MAVFLLYVFGILSFSFGGGSFARAFTECDPNVAVRRIEASFRKRGNSLSGKPLSAASDPVKDAEVLRVRVVVLLPLGKVSRIPFRE